MPTISTIPTMSHLLDVHNSLEKEFLDDRLYDMQSYAKELQIYLQELKNSQRTKGDGWYLLRQETDKLLSRNINTTLFKKGGRPGGVMFEKELVALTEALLNRFREEKITAADLAETFNNTNAPSTAKKVNSWTGPMNIKIQTKLTENGPKDLSQIPDAIMKRLLTQISNENAIEAYNKKTGQWKLVYRNYLDFKPKQGKVDFNGQKASARIPLDVTTTDKFERLAQLLTNFKFSLKNYSSKGYNGSSLWNEIHIDDTNPYKAYAIVLNRLGYTNEEINKTFRRMYWCYHALTVHGDTEHANHGVSLHMGHIQGVYGLIGEGLLDATGQNDKVDFIIINDPSSNGIYVQSADYLARQVLKNISKTVYLDRGTSLGVFGSGSVRISGSSL